MARNLSNLFEGTLHFAGTHASAFDSGIKISTRAVFHNLTPMLIFVLYEIDRFNNILVMKCRTDTKLGGEFLDVFPLSFVLSSLAELLRRFVSKHMNRRTKRGSAK